jgi:hypothetical protein
MIQIIILGVQEVSESQLHFMNGRTYCSKLKEDSTRREGWSRLMASNTVVKAESREVGEADLPLNASMMANT